MNLRRDHGSSQAATRLIVASLEENLSADVLQQITGDFVHALQKMGRDGLEVIINGVKKVYHVALFITLGDYPAQQALHGRKESVSAFKFCPCCNVTNESYKDSIDELPSHYTLQDYE
ncbi:unnamed protein product, partial [Didymodactylos carnosus]